MTEVTLFRSEKRLVGYEVRYHTGFAQAGEDIVCSAISALTLASANGITEVLKLSMAIDVGDAFLYCMLDKEIIGSDFDNAEIILNTMALGLRSIESEYSDFIKIIERGV